MTYGIVRTGKRPGRRCTLAALRRGRRGQFIESGDPMHSRISMGVALAATLLTGIFQLGTGLAATAEEDLIAAGSSPAARKLGPWLANVADEYRNSSNKRAFRSRNAAIRQQGGLIGVDLYANDAAGLQRSLAALGARNVKARGPLVSAQVPVSA